MSWSRSHSMNELSVSSLLPFIPGGRTTRPAAACSSTSRACAGTSARSDPAMVQDSAKEAIARMERPSVAIGHVTLRCPTSLARPNSIKHSGCERSSSGRVSRSSSCAGARICSFSSQRVNRDAGSSAPLTSWSMMPIRFATAWRPAQSPRARLVRTDSPVIACSKSLTRMGT